MVGNRKYLNLLFTFVIIAATTFLTFLLFYRDNNALGESFNVQVIYILVRNAAVVVGGGALLFRVIGVLRTNSNFIYMLIGSLNLIIAITCIVMYFLGILTMAWLNKCLLNTFVGFLILADIFLLNTIFGNENINDADETKSK